MKNFAKVIFDEIKSSPLEMIKGECKFPNHVPDDIPSEDDSKYEDFFDKNDVEIVFSFNNKNLGAIIPRQENVEYCKMGSNEEYNLVLHIEEPSLIKEDIMSIIIKFSEKWPYLHEFGEFIAFCNPKHK